MRRLMLVAIVVLAVFVAALFAVLIGAPIAPGIDLGAYAKPARGQTVVEAYQELEHLGGDLTVTRHYLTDWTDPRLGGFVAWSAENGNHPYISLHTQTGSTGITWAEVASGQQDDFLENFADSIQGLGAPVWFSFHHEPENDPDAGDSSDFRAAAQRVYEVMKPICSNCQIGVAFMRGTFGGAHGGIDSWLPDPQFMDFLGADLYDKGGTTQLSTLAATSLAKARSLDKPLVIGESGTVEGRRTSNYKATWFRNARTFLKANEDIMMYDYSHTTSQTYDYHVDTTPTALAAWREITADPYFA